MPTSRQIQDLMETLSITEQASLKPFTINDMFVTWGQQEFVERVTLDEGSCGTAACLCGTRALLDGGEVISLNVVVVDGETLRTTESWFRWGAERFGIIIEDARILFDPYNTMAMLRHYVSEIVAGQPLYRITHEEVS